MICQNLSKDKSIQLYQQVLNDNDTVSQKRLCKEDLFYLLYIACKRSDINHDWLYDRCREVELHPDGYLDLWARDHYKSTIITFAKSIQDILKNPEITIGIFSHTRPIAKGFLDQIKRELEANTYLQGLFPEALYQNPKSESPKWSLDSGIIVKRNSNPKEATIEAWGLVDGQPTSKHFMLRVYDDVVTRESVTTTEQIHKTTDALSLSYNLGTKGGKQRFIGTRYHTNDTYKEIIKRGTVSPRIYKATKDGTDTGDPVLLSKEDIKIKRRDMGPYIFSAQMLQDPTADKSMGFKTEWLKYYTYKNHNKWNVYLLVDPANEKKKTSDYTVMEVIGLAPDQNYYLLDAVRDRMNLTERTNKLFELHRKWKPKAVGYEKYGKDSDIEHIKYVMGEENYRFEISEVGGSMPKPDRIRRLVPIYEQGRFYTPRNIWFIDYEGKRVDYIQTYNNEEYETFPVCSHDDMMDCRARILDINAKFPKENKNIDYEDDYVKDGWMA